MKLYPLVISLVVVLALAAIALGLRGIVGESGKNEPTQSKESETISESSGANHESVLKKETSSMDIDAEAAIISFRSFLISLDEFSDGTQTLDQIIGFMGSLRAHPNRSAVIKAIVVDIENNSDVSTYLNFQLDRAGDVVSWPSFKGVLLDLLIEFDPVEAARLSEVSLFSRESSDLVPFAFLAFSAAGWEQKEFENMVEATLTYEPWLREAGPAYLNGFDAIVHLEMLGFVDRLAYYTSGVYSKGVQHAAYLTLKRMAQNNPTEVLSSLTSSGATREMAPHYRAEFHSLLDPGDPNQIPMIQQYLSSPEMTENELRRFVAYFPNLDRVWTRNLLSENVIPDSNAKISRLATAHNLLPTLSQTAAFARQPEEFTKLSAKLDELIASARRGGLLP
jgi:hypothetical protein